MKIYTEIVIDMKSLQVVSEKSFEYTGPIARCGGSGGSSTDKAYNARMASIYEKMQGQSDKLFNFYQYGTFSAPSATGAASTGSADGGGTWSGGSLELSQLNKKTVKNTQTGADMIYYQDPWDGKWKPGNKVQDRVDMYNSMITTGMSPDVPKTEFMPSASSGTSSSLYGLPATGSGPNGQITLADLSKQNPSYANMELMQVAANQELIPAETEMQLGEIGLEQRANKYKRESIPMLYDLANENNEGTAMAEASAQVNQAYNNQAMQIGNNMRRAGAMPGSDYTNAVFDDLNFDRAKAIAGARTAARNTSRVQRFTMLSDLYKTPVGS